MTFSNQPARILVEKDGYSMLHCGITYNSEKVTVAKSAMDTATQALPKNKYCDVFVSGCCDTQKNEITITSIEIPSC